MLTLVFLSSRLSWVNQSEDCNKWFYIQYWWLLIANSLWNYFQHSNQNLVNGLKSQHISLEVTLEFSTKKMELKFSDLMKRLRPGFFFHLKSGALVIHWIEVFRVKRHLFYGPLKLWKTELIQTSSWPCSVPYRFLPRANSHALQ